MSQGDMIIENADGLTVRTDINNNLQALISNSSGLAGPSTTYAHQWYADTTDGVLKIRSPDNLGYRNVLDLETGTAIGAGGLRFISSTEITSLTQYAQFDDDLTAEYDTYFVTFENVIPEEDGRAWIVEFSDDGGSSWLNTNYQYVVLYTTTRSSGLILLENENVAINLYLTAAFISDQIRIGHNLSGNLTIHSPNVSDHIRIESNTSYESNTVGEFVKATCAGTNIDSTNSINGIRFYFSNGNIESGIIRLYGIIKA